MGQDLRQEAISLIRKGQPAEARPLFIQVLRKNPKDVSAWFWLLETAIDTDEQIKMLEQCLRHNPENLKAKEKLDILNASSQENISASDGSEHISTVQSEVHQTIDGDYDAGQKMSSLPKSPEMGVGNGAKKEDLIRKWEYIIVEQVPIGLMGFGKGIYYVSGKQGRVKVAGPSTEELVKVLDSFGDKGWEVAGFNTQVGNGTTITYIWTLKRLVE
jgi:tetratricopeptide (TPR) repeat protein